MRLIEIQKSEDFDKLRNLKKNESIYVKIMNEISNVKLAVIDLKKYKGTIFVSFENPKKKRKFNVVIENKCGSIFLFSNANQCSIHIDPANYKTYYQKQPKSYSIFKDQDFDNLPKILLPKTKLILKRELVLMRECPSNYHEVIFEGNYHTIYAKKNILDSWIKNGATFQNTNFMEVDQVLPIVNFSDLNQVLEYPNSRVVAFLQTNIMNQTIQPINLEMFSGTLVLLGNGYHMDYIVLEDTPSAALGLISSISSSANFLCRDISISHINYQNSCKEHFGAILGEKKAFKSKYPTFPGYTLFQNCVIKNCCIPFTMNSGAFIGFADEYTDFVHCKTEDLFGYDHQKFIGNISYFDEEHLTDAMSFKGKKNICISSRVLRKEKQ